MLSKQLPLLERKKKSASPDMPMQIQSKHLQVHGDHQCSKKCLEYLEEALSSSEYEEYNKD